MRTTDSMTLTNRRQFDPLKVLVNQIIDEREIEKTINKTVDASKIRTGILKKYYPYVDKAEVQLDNVTKPVVCRIAHNFAGSVVDFFTPAGERGFCDNLKEVCFYPKEELHVFVADISNEDAKEMLLIGYYFPNDIVGIKPASPGYMKITDIGATNQWGVEIGQGEVKITTSDGIKVVEGEYHADNTEINYADSANTYTKKEVYTKEEVDELIKKAIDDLKEEIINGDTENVTS